MMSKGIIGPADIKGMRWYHSPVEAHRVKVYPVGEEWLCPELGCDGRMQHNGVTWPTADPGYQHVCNKCGVGYAIHGGTYPRVAFMTEEEMIKHGLMSPSIITQEELP